jgi:hypothetical protein
MSPDKTNVSPRRNNHWFTAAAVFAGVLLGAHFADGVRPESALAQPGTKKDDNVQPPFNSAGDRKILIDSLADVNVRLGRIEAKLNSGINVKVTEMPAAKESKP